jgi:hypothetical protein
MSDQDPTGFYKETLIPLYILKSESEQILDRYQTLNKIDDLLKELSDEHSLNEKMHFLQLEVQSSNNVDDGFKLHVYNNFNNKWMRLSTGQKVTFEELNNLDKTLVVYEDDLGSWSASELQEKLAIEIELIQDWAKALAEKYGFKKQD